MPGAADLPTASTSRKRMVEAIANGTVIDHIPAERTLAVARLIAHHGDQVFIGVNLRSSRHGRKGVVKVANRDLTDRDRDSLALLAGEATICVIRDYTVASKARVPVPARVVGIARCANPNCVTNHERWTTAFTTVAADPLHLRCDYCERPFAAATLALLDAGTP